MRALSTSEWDVVVRVLVATGLGAFVGLERSQRRIDVGARTLALVAAGSALATGVTMLVTTDLGPSNPARGDIFRVAAAVIGGVGFLGAGAIITDQQGERRGLTTAAAIWVTAALGITVGFGYLWLGALSTAIVVLLILAARVAETRTVGGSQSSTANHDREGDDG